MLPSSKWPAPANAFVSPMIGETAWNVAKGHGSFLTLEFGPPSLVAIKHPSRDSRSAHVRGAWGLWIYCCHWKITHAGAQLDTRNNRDFGRLMIRSLFDEVSVGI